MVALVCWVPTAAALNLAPLCLSLAAAGAAALGSSSAMSLAAASRCAYSQARSLVNHIVGAGLRRFPVSTKARDAVRLGFVNTELMAQGEAWVLESYELATVVERLMKCTPCGAAQHERFPAETLDYVARQRERAKLVNAQSAARAAALLAGRKPPKTKPRTRIFCARSTRCARTRAAPGRVSKRLCRSRCRGARSQHFARRAPRQRRCSASLRARRARPSTATARSPPTRADPNPARSKRTCTSRATLFRSAF